MILTQLIHCLEFILLILACLSVTSGEETGPGDKEEHYELPFEELKRRLTELLANGQERKIIEFHSSWQEKLELDIDESVSQLSRQQQETAEILARNIIETREYSYNQDALVYELNVAKGLLGLLELRNSIANDKIEALLDQANGGKKLFEKVIEETNVRDDCETVYERLKQIIEFYDTFGSFREKVLQIVDEYTADWLMRGRFCQKFLSKTSQIIKLAYQEFFKNNFRDQYNEWQALKKQLYGESYIKPEEVLAKLKRMQELYLVLSPLNLLSDTDHWSWRDDKELIRFGNEVSEEKCRIDYFNELTEAKKLNFIFTKTLLSYLHHFGSKQYEFCKSIVDQKLEQAVKKLSKEQQTNLDLLADKVLSSCDSCTNANSFSHEIDRGALAFLEAKSKINLNKNTSVGKLTNMFQDLISSLCFDVTTYLETPIRLEQELNLRGYLEERPNDQLVSAWILRYEICRRLEDEKIIRIYRMHKNLLAIGKQGKTSFVEKVLSFFLF